MAAATTQRVTRERQAAIQAAELIVFADGLEEAGLAVYAQRARCVARDTIWLVDELEAERSARKAIQHARDQALELLAQRVYTACKKEA